MQTKYPNIYVETYMVFSDALENRANAAGVTMELYKAVLHDGEDLTLTELKGLYRRFLFTTYVDFARSFEYFTCGKISVLNKNKGRWRYKIPLLYLEIENIIERFPDNAERLYSSDCKDLRDLYSKIKSRNYLFPAEYRKALELVNSLKRYIEFANRPKKKLRSLPSGKRGMNGGVSA